jgi:serine/threonine-protein kinase
VLSRFQAEELLRGNFRRLRIGKFILQDVVGFGGMGNVYRVRDTEEHRVAALKVLSKRFQHDKGMRARFRLEAEAGLLLDHPHLVRTLGFGETQELYGEVDYMVMEFFEGIALHEVVSVYGLIKYDSVCDMACQAAAGLEQMHKQDLIHRDVKPDNVLVGHDGTVKLVDFGLALADKRALDDEFSLSMIFGHDGLGTLDYMAPEQSYDSMTVDPRADVYGLGCTLFAVITGRRPFPYPQRSQVLAGHRTEAPPSVLERAPHVPIELASLIQKMMAKKPEDRFPSMSAVQEALTPFAKRRPIPFDFPAILNRRRDEAAGEAGADPHANGSASVDDFRAGFAGFHARHGDGARNRRPQRYVVGHSPQGPALRIRSNRLRARATCADCVRHAFYAMRALLVRRTPILPLP